MAQLINTDGSIKKVEPKNGTDFELEELQKFVDGYIEIVNLNDGRILVVNDEGKFGYEVNEKATLIAQQTNAIWFGDTINGNALLCKSEEVK